jgi:hypothetical protein
VVAYTARIQGGGNVGTFQWRVGDLHETKGSHYNIKGVTTSWVLLCILEDMFFSSPETLLKPQTKCCLGVTMS